MRESSGLRVAARNNNSKHIVVDARESRTTTGRYIDKLIEYLQIIDTKNKYSLVMKTKAAETWTLTNPNFKIITCDVKEFTFAEQFVLAKVLYGLKADLVHFPMVQQPVLYWKRSTTTLQDLTTLRFYNPAKNYLVFKAKQLVYYFVNWFAVVKSKELITISNFVKGDVERFFPLSKNKKFTVTLESSDVVSSGRESVKELEGKKFIFYVGQSHPHKNLNRLVQAHKILTGSDSATADRGPVNPDADVVLAIVGKSGKDNPHLHRFVETNGNADKILYTGFVSDEQLAWLYKNCQAYIAPSLSEGFGLPGLEAMKNGAPLVSSNATCLPEIYKDGAEYFDPLDVSDMAEKISKVINDPKLQADLKVRGAKVAAGYSWRRMAEETLGVYEGCLG
jgi:glycosyltransferase involved in cell wall biosynthesis